MPVSIHIQVTECLERIIKLKPKSVLDIGCGFGKWGYLCREYLDVFHGRPYPDQWTTRIDGIEFFEPYIMDHQRFLYSNILIGDVRDLCKEVDEYDLIIAGDVIEHLYKDEAEEVLETLYGKARQMLMVNIPLGPGWIHPEEYGNPAELHRSEWYADDFQPFRAECVQYGSDESLKYGSFFCRKGVPDEGRVMGCLCASNFHADRDGGPTALRYARRAVALQPENTDATTFLVDLLLKQGDAEGAIEALKAGLNANPAFHMGKVFLAQILGQLGRLEEGREQMNALLREEDVDAACRERAEQWLAANDPNAAEKNR